MNNLSASDPSPALQRKRQLMLVAGFLLLCAVATYFIGGQPEVDTAGQESSPFPFEDKNKKGTKPRDDSVDEFFPELSNDKYVETKDESLLKPTSEVTLARNGSSSPPPDTKPNSPGIQKQTEQAKPAPISQTTVALSHANGASISGTPEKSGSAMKGSGQVAGLSSTRATETPTATADASQPAKSQPISTNVAKAPPLARSSNKPKLVLKQPAKRVRGVAAHTANVITEQEYNDEEQTAATAAASVPTQPRVVKATKSQAQAFADKSTRTWQSEGRIQPAQHFRLPKQSETRNARIWREEDEPSSPKERRAFGLVLTEDSPNPEPATTTTAEGIPVRNVPEGQSALKKDGPDKPLWKRPE